MAQSGLLALNCDTEGRWSPHFLAALEGRIVDGTPFLGALFSPTPPFAFMARVALILTTFPQTLPPSFRISNVSGPTVSHSLWVPKLLTCRRLSALVASPYPRIASAGD